MKYRYAKVRGIVVSYEGDSQYLHDGPKTISFHEKRAAGVPTTLSFIYLLDE